MKAPDLRPNAGLYKALEALFTAVGEALIEQKIKPTRALRRDHKQAFVALHEARKQQ